MRRPHSCRSGQSPRDPKTAWRGSTSPSHPPHIPLGTWPCGQFPCSQRSRRYLLWKIAQMLIRRSHCLAQIFPIQDFLLPHACDVPQRCFFQNRIFQIFQVWIHFPKIVQFALCPFLPWELFWNFEKLSSSSEPELESESDESSCDSSVLSIMRARLLVFFPAQKFLSKVSAVFKETNRFSGSKFRI